MRHFTIDQAGKIEFTNVDTVLAFSSTDIQYSIKVPLKLKQEIFDSCKKRYKNILTYKIFAYSLFLLLKNKIEKDSIIIIDDEYPKHGRDIKQFLLKSLKIDKDRIRIDRIGKKNPAHRIANKTYSGKLKPNEIITGKQLNLKKIFSKKRLERLLK